MRFTITLFALSLFFIYSVYAIHISEVHPYPEGGEEWVEIFINESINITELQVSDNYQTDRVTCCGENCTETIAGPGYFILTAADSNHSYGCSRVCVDDKSIGNGLGNEWDNISLLYRGNITESFLYNWTIKGRSVILTEGEYIQVLPTPCESNALSMLLLNRTRYNLGEVLEFIIEGYGLNVSAELNLSSQNMSQLYLIPLSELNYLLVNETGNYTLGIVVDTIQRNYSFEIISEEIIEQDCVFSITMDSHIFEVGDQVSFDLQVEFCNITYWIEDSGGRQAKAPYTTHTSGVKKFTPDNGGGYILYATSGKETKELYFIVKENISAESAIFVALKNESYVFGKPISVSLQVHKGDTGKTAIYLYVQDEEKISETVILHIDKKFTELDVTVPVLLDEKCGLPSSEYTLVAEGLDLRKEVMIEISSIPCEKKQSASAAKKANTPTSAKSYSQPIQPKMYFFTHEVKGDTLYLYLSLSNTDLVEHTYAIESYLSDGTKEEAAQDLVTVGPGMRENMTLTKKVSGLSGNYSLKIKVLRDDRKTPYLLSDTLFFEGTKVFIESIPEEEKITGPIPEPATETTIAQQQITGNVVFESKSEKQSMLKTYLSVGAVAVSLLLAAGFIRTRATK